MAARTEEETMDELGDLLFTVVNLCRKKHIKPQDALSYANNKFTRRFNVLKQLAEQKGLELEKLTAEQYDVLWNQAKEIVRQNH